MRCSAATLLWIISCAGWLDAVESPPRPAVPAVVTLSAHDAALENLLTERKSPAALQTAIDQARKQGVNEQVILEARFLFLVDRHDDAGIAALLPEFTKRRANFNLDDSKSFACTDDWLAVNEYVEAIAALNQGDKPAFKQHITEAFWLSPRQGAAFAPHIERLHLEEAMRSIKIDFATQFITINTNQSKTLKKLLGDNQALMLHFWSPWSDESEAAMADFNVTAKVLMANNIAVVSCLPQASAKLLADAVAALKTLGAKPAGAWLVDNAHQPMARQLRVFSLPTMVLVATDGHVLFNGHPDDDALWQALLKVNPAIHRQHPADRPVTR
ncbi:MAG: hypothetical protein DVB25_00775 [Verrucomicrobia bacterium]|nr:MAG: hypothetical protein DVB25_00775 [Verrucomicrobiota bacterium]